MPKFREITGQFVGYIPDGTDPDIIPDRAPMSGLVTFTPIFTGGVIAFPELAPPEFAHPKPIYAHIIDGFVRVQVESEAGTNVQPLSLMVTLDDEANQTWSWRAEFNNVRVGSSESTVEIPSWQFAVPDGSGPVDLTELIPVKTASGTGLAKGPRGAGLQSITAQDGQLVFGYTNGEETTVPIPEAVQGPQGEPGPAGADGEQGPEGPQGPPGEIPDLLVSNISDATPTGKNLMLAATEGAARNALGLATGATSTNGSAEELNTGTSNTPRVWTASNIASYVTAGISAAKTVVNVKDFGAKGDGSTDDTLPIRNSINYAASAENCTVYFPPGDYWIPRGTHLEFTNPGSGQFTRRVFDIPSNVKITGHGATILHDGDYTWRKIIFYIAGSSVSIEGMTFRNIYDMAGGSRPTDIPIASGSIYDLDAESISDITIKNCTFHRPWHPTKFAYGDSPATITGITIEGCTSHGEPEATSSGGYNFYSKPPLKVTDVTVSGNKIYDMSVSAAIGLYGVGKATVSGNICKRSGLAGAGIQLENGADHVAITGNVLEDHFNHIWVDDSTNVTITGNAAINYDTNSSYKGVRITFQGHEYDYNQRVTNIVASNNILTNCRIASEQFSTVGSGYSPGIGDLTITNNQVHLDGSASAYGISTHSCGSVLIASNIVVGAAATSVLVSTSVREPSQAVVVMGNYTRKLGSEASAGLRISGGYGTLPIVESNRFTNGVEYTRALFGSVGQTLVATGQGSPEGAVSAPRGSVYIRSDGSSSSEVFYVKNGDGLVGWVAK